MTGQEKRQTPAWEEPGPVHSFASSPEPTSQHITPNRSRNGNVPTWAALAEMVPELTQLEHKMKSAYANRRPREDLLARHWYSKGGGKAALAELIGNERGEEQWSSARRRLFGGKVALSTDDMFTVDDQVQKATEGRRSHDEANGLGVLWTFEAWDVAYNHLVDVLLGREGRGR